MPLKYTLNNVQHKYVFNCLQALKFLLKSKLVTQEGQQISAQTKALQLYSWSIKIADRVCGASRL